ncbi:retrotransposon protein, putative, ty1-copia subclass [Tanacetum coccineum]
MMNLTTLPLSFWDYALESFVRILNMVPTNKGSEALVKRDTLDKLQQRSVKCIFIGYPNETMGYYFYFPPKNKIVVARYVEFLEKNLISQEASGRAVELEEIQDEDTSNSYGEVEKNSLEDLNEPTNYKATILDMESDNKNVGSKWIFKKKTDMGGIVHTYKACLVAKGFTQTYGVDYEETFSPVADIRAIRILIAIVAFYDYEIWQMDVKTAFLNGYVDEDIYMVQLEGFVDPKHPRKVCKLQRSIYGLKQASRSWNKSLMRKSKSLVLFKILMSHISKRLIGLSQSAYMDKILKRYRMDNSKRGNIPMQEILDLNRTQGASTLRQRDRSKRLIGLCQNTYMDKILKRYKIDNSKRGHIPMQERLDLNKSQGAQTPKEVNRMKNVPYASAVGSIMYAVRCTRPNVAFTQNITSHFQQNPGEPHWTAVNSILKYLRNTKYVFLVYGAIDWKSSKQSTTVMSATEAECIAASEAAMEAVWIRKFISGLVHTDNNLADPFTKALSKGKLTQHARSMGLHLACSFM